MSEDNNEYLTIFGRHNKIYSFVVCNVVYDIEL